jgi:hypothetical protein
MANLISSGGESRHVSVLRRDESKKLEQVFLSVPDSFVRAEFKLFLLPG